MSRGNLQNAANAPENGVARLHPVDVDPGEARLLQPAELVEESRRLIDRVRLGIGVVVPAFGAEGLVRAESPGDLERAAADRTVPGAGGQSGPRRRGRLDQVGDEQRASGGRACAMSRNSSRFPAPSR